MRTPAAPLLAFALSASVSHAAIIVGLDPTAPSNFFNSPGSVTLATSAPSDNPAGLTMNVTFTPSATDIGRTTNAVNLLEIGGNANGTGLYLLGGELHFLSKMQGSAANVPNPFDDLDFASGNNMVGVKSAFGMLLPDVEYSVGVLYDPLGSTPTLTLAVQPSGGSVFQQTETFTGVGAKNNWSGNDTITAFASPSNAGAGNTVSGNAFQEGAPMFALDGTAGRALLWNAQGTIIPEPAAATLIGLGALLLLRRRR